MAHKAGTFCWTELMTTDLAKARPFYAALLGWTYKEVPMPGGPGAYLMPQVEGKDAAGMAALQPEQAKQMPPHWSVYVAVDDVAATLKKATDLGAKTVMPTFDIPNVGRMAVFQDPTGAHLSLWWTKGMHAGTGTDAAKTGAFCWSELLTTNIDKAQGFYTKLFGWKTKGGDHAGANYVEWQNGNETIGGMMSVPKGVTMPSSWMPYFTVPDAKKRAEVAKMSGGQILNGPMEIPSVGWSATIADPQGAVFSLYQATVKR
jgi:uncharacterized protein